MPLDPQQLAAIREASTEPALRAARDLLLAEVERLTAEGDRLREALTEKVRTWRRFAAETEKLKAGMADAPAHWAGADMRVRMFRECADAILDLAALALDAAKVTKCAFCADAAKEGRKP
jgi:hypothetical protein